MYHYQPGCSALNSLASAFGSLFSEAGTELQEVASLVSNIIEAKGAADNAINHKFDDIHAKIDRVKKNMTN